MSLPQTLSHLLIHIGTSFAHIESNLYIPTCLHFFPPSASLDELRMLALLFVVAPPHGYITLPMLEYLGLGEREAGWRWEWRRCVKWHIQLLSMFWAMEVQVRVCRWIW
jgi:hypothetical protein